MKSDLYFKSVSSGSCTFICVPSGTLIREDCGKDKSTQKYEIVTKDNFVFKGINICYCGEDSFKRITGGDAD